MKVKKKIISSIVALSFTAATLPFIYAETANTSEAISELTALGKQALTLADKSLSGGNLRAKIDSKFGKKYTDLKKLVIQEGELTVEDCRFIRQSLTSLEELVIEKNANFANSMVPKSAFDGMTSLKKVTMTQVKELGLKSFSGCENLEEIDFPNVTKTGVQVFAQAKGSNSSQLKVARLPKLKHAEPRMFYYCTNLAELYLTNPPTLTRPVGKEGLWFERVTKMIIHVPSRKEYDEFMKAENCTNIDWSAFNFTADNGDQLPSVKQAAEYKDSDYDFLRKELLPRFDKTNKV